MPKSPVSNNDSQTTDASGLLAPGTQAPDFTLHYAPHQMLSLSELRGKPVILAFYPADWSPTCGDQIGLYNEVLPEFQKFGAELLGISVDGPWCHKAYARSPQSAFQPALGFRAQGSRRQTVRRLPQRRRISERALFVIEKDGIIAWSYLSPVRVNPGADGILEALENLPK